jgi:hypothetical protein
MLKQKHGRRRHALSIAAGAAALFLVLFLTHCSGKKSGWKPVPGPLTTRWTDKVSPDGQETMEKFKRALGSGRIE